MRDHPEICDNRARREAALRWFVRARAEDFSAAERTEMNAWLADNPQHREEYARLQQTWRTLDRLPGQTRYLNRPSATRRRPAWLLYSGAACAAAVAILLTLRMQPARFETPPGEYLRVEIAQGIEASLDAGSAIEVRNLFHPEVRLLRGNAYFAVQEGGAKGLEVQAGDAHIRDIGTRFAVTEERNDWRVAVADGKVEIRLHGTRQMVEAEQQARFDSRRVAAPASIKPESVAAWRNGEYYFDNTPLNEVAAEIRRHSQLQVEIPDSHVATLTVSGRYGIHDPGRLLWAIAQIHALETMRQPDGRVVLTRK